MNKVIKILKKFSALITDGHFVGVSGRHMDTYINKDALFPHVKETSLVGKMFAEKNRKLNIDVVAAPALGGIILAQWTAYHLSKIRKKKVMAVFTEKTPDGGQVFTRGYDKYVEGKKVLVLEDLTTTGGSANKVIESVKRAGGKVVRVSVMVNKNPENVTAKTFGVPFNFLGKLAVRTYEPKNCPMCKKNIPINTQFGHGKKFLCG